MSKKVWLMKSEPSCYSIDDLQKDKETAWTGVRNYQARNFMMKDMNIGDEVLFYHSNAQPSGVAGFAEVSSKAIADFTALDPNDEHFDPKATPSSPRWFCVKVKFKKKLPHIISLQDIKNIPELQMMEVLKKGNRLSIQPVTIQEYSYFSHFLDE